MTAAQSALDALDRAHGKLDALEGRPVAPTVRIEPTPEAVLRALADLEQRVHRLALTDDVVTPAKTR